MLDAIRKCMIEVPTDEELERAYEELSAIEELIASTKQLFIEDTSHHVCDVYGVRSCFECGDSIAQPGEPVTHRADCNYYKALMALAALDKLGAK